ncbi:MAG: SGNH/GDSL hydrolase family protein [Verrucomicrobiales bacterium]|nr:SGNH/GDSL hydrolase family protein [Verrucomicrobiales bacterium]
MKSRIVTLFSFLSILSIFAILPGAESKAEPTNAIEAAAKKAAAEAEVDSQYAALVEKLPAAERAWEEVLQSELGNFYLPIHKKQKVQGQSNAWDFVHDDPNLPRVLLIGDSISRGYTRAVRREMKGEANVHRAPANCGPTATGLKKLDIWLGNGKWSVIHFNFGIHDRKTPPEEYQERLREIVTRLKATGAVVIWASTTPVPTDWKEGPEMAAAIAEKNQIAAKVMKENGVEINDLFTFITPHLEETQNAGDVHFGSKGYDLLGGQVAGAIREVIEK